MDGDGRRWVVIARHAQIGALHLMVLVCRASSRPARLFLPPRSLQRVVAPRAICHPRLRAPFGEPCAFEQAAHVTVLGSVGNERGEVRWRADQTLSAGHLDDRARRRHARLHRASKHEAGEGEGSEPRDVVRRCSPLWRRVRTLTCTDADDVWLRRCLPLRATLRHHPHGHAPTAAIFC